MLGDQLGGVAPDVVQAMPSPPPQQLQQFVASHQYHQQLSHSLSNEWTLDDSTVEAWAHEVASSPDSFPTSLRARSSTGQLELKSEQEAQLRARWNRLVEDHFGVKLENVDEGEEGNEEDQDAEGGTKHRPSLEKKFQGFLQNLGKMLPHSESFRNLSTGLQSSDGSFGSQAFAGKGRMLSRQSTQSNTRGDREKEAGREKSGRGRGGAGSERNPSVSRASAEAEGGNRREGVSGCTKCTNEVGDAAAAAAGATSRASSGAVPKPAKEGRITRTPEEAWALVRQAVCTSRLTKDNSSGSTSSSVEQHEHEH